MAPPPADDVNFANNVAGAGGTIVRLEFDWAYAQPNPPSSPNNGYAQGYWDHMHHLYDSAWNANVGSVQHVRLELIPMDAPYWARPSGTQQCGNGVPSNCVSPPSSAHYPDYDAFVRKIATEFPQAIIEIWNEPNYQTFWRPEANMPMTTYYPSLLAGAYSAVKAVSPTTTVLTAGLNNEGYCQGCTVQPGDVSLGDALAAIYQGAGANSFDGISFHASPCPNQSPQTEPIVESASVVRGVRHMFNDDGKPLWLTEIAATSAIAQYAGNCGTHFDENTQGPVLASALNWVHCQSDFAAGLVNGLYEQTMRTDPTMALPITDGNQGIGLIAWYQDPLFHRYSYRYKPAYSSVVTAIQTPPACPQG